MEISYSSLIDSGLFSASLVLKQKTEVVTSHDGQRIVNSDYGHTYFVLQLNFRYYPNEAETAPPIDEVFSLGMTEKYIIPVGEFSEAILSHSNIRGMDESATAHVMRPGSTELTIEFLSSIASLVELEYGNDALFWGLDSLEYGTALGVTEQPQIDHAGRLFSLQGKIYVIIEDLDVTGNQTKRFKVAPPLRKSGIFSSQYNTLQLGTDLLFTGRLDKPPALMQATDGWLTYKLLFVEDSI